LYEFLNVGKGISDDIARRFPVYALDFTDGMLANVYESVGLILNFCDAMSCLQCALNVFFDMCNNPPISYLKEYFDKTLQIGSVAHYRILWCFLNEDASCM